MLYGTFLFMPYDASTMEITQRGVVIDHIGKPLAGAAIDLAYGDRTYHTFTSSTGGYRFIGLKRLSNPAVQNGTISVRNVKRQVALRSQSSNTVQLP